MTAKLKSFLAGHNSSVSRIFRRFDVERENNIPKDLDMDILEGVHEDDIEKEILDLDEYKFNFKTTRRKIRKCIHVQTSNLIEAARSFSLQYETLRPI